MTGVALSNYYLKQTGLDVRCECRAAKPARSLDNHSADMNGSETPS